ncbi:MAG TPA: AAA family ATPase [Burkholderiaceae bacterium]|nr:AAA family ATPase [Burkholderiaceae bacterium]
MKIGRQQGAAATEPPESAVRAHRSVLEIRLLGELQVVRDGTPIALPASKKTRALLGYLVATGRAHLRERLCELLWEGPGDPRAELRWSLTKLRPLVNDAAAERLRGDRERVLFDAGDAAVDLMRARALLAAGVDTLPVEALLAAARLLEGELLDGLDLPACPRFHEWAAAEREAVSALRVATLKALLRRVANQPEDALALARKWVAADPLAEPAHAAVVRQLGALGRARDALAHYQHARRLLEAELAAPLTGELDEARRAVQRAHAAAAAGATLGANAAGADAMPGADAADATAGGNAAIALATAGANAAGMGALPGANAAIAAAIPGGSAAARGGLHAAGGYPPQRPALGTAPATPLHPAVARAASAADRLIGRARERECIEQQLAACVGQPTAVTPFLLFAGEPGIGKSRLLEHLRERAAAAGGSVAAARAFEAEVARPYGIWVDALRSIDKNDVPAALREDLATLLPELAAADRNAGAAALNAQAQAGDRLRLFDAVVALLRHAAARRPLVVLLLDDLQWADDASCALLHYVARALRPQADRAGTPPPAGRAGHVLIAGAARTHELEENAAARNLLASLAREQQLRRLDLDPLSAMETAELVRAVAPTLDAAAIFAASDGNPLFARELAQARAQGIDWSARSLGGLLRAQLGRLDLTVRELLTYAAAFGRSFAVEGLGVACSFGAAALTSALGELERRGVLRAVDEARYDFAHDLVRQAAYGNVSQPRRRLLHAQIARALALAAERDETLHAEVARHASLAGEHELAVRACIAAGERALRSFAGAEAATLAEMGLRHLQALPATREKLRMHVGLLSVKVTAHTVLRGLRHPPAMLDQLLQAVAAAEAAGLHAEAAHGYHLVAVLYQDAGNHALAQQSTLRAEHAGRAADDMTRVRHLALTAQCLIDLERDVERARPAARGGAGGRTARPRAGGPALRHGPAGTLGRRRARRRGEPGTGVAVGAAAAGWLARMPLRGVSGHARARARQHRARARPCRAARCHRQRNGRSRGAVCARPAGARRVRRRRCGESR